MSIDIAAVTKVARLARIKVTDEEKTAHAEKLGNIIGFIDQLSEVDTDNVEPLASVVDIKLRLRPDEVTDGGVQSDVLKNAEDSLEGFIAVPKVVE